MVSQNATQDGRRKTELTSFCHVSYPSVSVPHPPPPNHRTHTETLMKLKQELKMAVELHAMKLKPELKVLKMRKEKESRVLQ